MHTRALRFWLRRTCVPHGIRMFASKVVVPEPRALVAIDSPRVEIEFSIQEHIGALVDALQVDARCIVG